MPKIIQVSVIGPSSGGCSTAMYEIGEKLGKALVDADKVVITGGKGGIMEAVCRGARNSRKHKFGRTIGILPTYDKGDANIFCDVVIPTGLGLARNTLVAASGDVIIAVAGGSGTLSELSLAWQLGKPIIAYVGEGGWGEKLASRRLDGRRKDQIYPAKDIPEIMTQLKQLEED
ncbi:MAG: TIGR00725 family protein [Bacteroidota bacterium]